MPIHLVTVTRVFKRDTIKRGLHRYDVSGQHAKGGNIYSTLDAWKASLCEQARRQNTPIEIGWRDTRYGPEIVTATFPKAQAS